MKTITALITRYLLAILFVFSFVPGLVFSATPAVKGEHDVIVDAFIDIDPYSTVEVENSETEIGLWREIRVKVTDRLGNPLSGRQIEFFVDSGDIIFEQPTLTTDADGYARGRVRSFSPGAYTLKALDTTYSSTIAIQDTAILYVFPLPIPSIDAEPYYTRGTTNTLYWGKLTGFDKSYEYQLQVASDSEFTKVVKTTAWLTDSQVRIEGLKDGGMYFYRIKARNSGLGESDWSNTVFSVQDAVAPVIKMTEKPDVKKENKNLVVTFKFNVTDNLALKKVDLYCKTREGLKKCGGLQSIGSNYTASILLDELEKGKLFNFKNEYNFCVEAVDEAGNRGSNCGFNLKFERPVEIPVPVFTNAINSILNGINDRIAMLDDFITDMMNGFNQFALSLLGFLLLIISLIVSFTILLGGIAFIPSMIMHNFYRLWSLFGFRKHGTPVGVVYDSVTKKPIKYARVYIYDNDHYLIRKDVTGPDGIFTASMDTGKFRVIAYHNHYLFPSNIVKKGVDEQYQNVYRGEYILLGRRKVMNISIPLDPINMFDSEEKKEYMKFRFVHMLKYLNILVTLVGLLVAVYGLERSTNWFNLLLVLLYIPVFGVYLKSVVHLNIGMK